VLAFETAGELAHIGSLDHFCQSYVGADIVFAPCRTWLRPYRGVARLRLRDKLARVETDRALRHGAGLVHLLVHVMRLMTVFRQLRFGSGSAPHPNSSANPRLRPLPPRIADLLRSMVEPSPTKPDNGFHPSGRTSRVGV